ncbi:VWA domain-containing protein [Halomonas urumqiensis]|uniref:VWFA domain-containing protein n=1 Tax=Halomonas urumqiensis TaxID=1684789 RepID=A0A2N7UFD9_9GAMM|nr:vWA domain-containing protein [Halomonas urumqiensis]PMR79156.1 hypothetical protein C1H70_12700 [Halomonas urumqiensis]PTB03831.1 VWA domain-containing protein [Halomonas urumqiensis]GHE19934.1 hypothetical protein GCM10017767_04550 [Halomonas urumqiensis]
MTWWQRFTQAGHAALSRLSLSQGMVALVVLLVVTPVLAQRVQENPDVRVIIDISGSMRVNDPNQFSASALELLVSLLPDDTSAGVWTFGERVDNPLPLDRVDEAWRERATALRPALVEYQPYTDIEAAVREAASPEANGWRHIILLTDGVIDLSPSRGAKPAVDVASRRELLEVLGPRLADRGIVVHAIAFSDDADLALVEQLAQATGGLPALVETPESLLGAFLDIVERIFPADQVPIEAEGDVGRFAIEPGVDAFSALLFHSPEADPLVLVGPDGTVYRSDDLPDGISWQVEPLFDLIRVEEPLAGEWRLQGELGEGSRISVVSKLNLVTSPLPATLYLGVPVPVDAWLEREGEPFGDDLEGLEMRVELRDQHDDVQSALRLERQGQRFFGELPAPALTGGARLLIRAEAEGFTRQRVQAVNVLPVISATHQPAAERVRLTAEHPELDHDNTELVGELAGETLTAEPSENGEWLMALPPLDDSVSQPLMLTATVTLDGETREIRLPRLVLNPEAETGLGVAGSRSGGPQSERFHEDLATGYQGPGANIADRFVSSINAMGRHAVEAWEAGAPGVLRAARTIGSEPRYWAAAALVCGILLLLVITERIRRSRRRVVHREEPHV